MTAVRAAFAEIKSEHPTAYTVLDNYTDELISKIDTPIQRAIKDITQNFLMHHTTISKHTDTKSGKLKLDIYNVNAKLKRNDTEVDTSIIQGHLTLGGVSYTLENCVIIEQEDHVCELIIEKVKEVL